MLKALKLNLSPEEVLETFTRVALLSDLKDHRIKSPANFLPLIESHQKFSSHCRTKTDVSILSNLYKQSFS